MRIALARLLLSEPDILILDEVSWLVYRLLVYTYIPTVYSLCWLCIPMCGYSLLITWIKVLATGSPPT